MCDRANLRWGHVVLTPWPAAPPGRQRLARAQVGTLDLASMLRRRRKNRNRKSSDIDEDALRVVLRYLDASGQSEISLHIGAYLRMSGCWSGRVPESAEPTASDDAAVGDDFALGSALLDLTRSLPPIQAAFIGTIEILPPWSDTADLTPIGKLANMFDVAERVRSTGTAHAAGSESAARIR